MNKPIIQWSQEEIALAVQEAREGVLTRLNHFFANLYQRGIPVLMGLTQSEEDARSYLSDAILRFKQKFVETDKALPEKNIEGYIFTMAKFAFYDAQKQQRTTNIESVGQVPDQEVAEHKDTHQFRTEDDLQLLQQRAMMEGIKKLTGHCQQLFETIMDTGEEKSSKLYPILGWKDARQVTTRRHDCTKQLKVKAAIILETLLHQRNQEI
ncbi:MAG: hypothetical protein AAFO82_13385 [Bacteroidota bacterium]